MKHYGLKIFVVFLLFVELATIALFYYLLKSMMSANSGVQGFLHNDMLIYSLLVLLILIAVIFTGIIIFRPARIVIAETREYVQTTNEKLETKRKQEPDTKKNQEQNEKKRMMLNEMVKGLDTRLNPEEYASQVLVNISKQIDIFQGILFLRSTIDGVFRKAGTYAYYSEDEFPEFPEGVGLTGQVAANKKLLNVVNIPDKYLTVLSGLGKSSPGNLIIFPLLHNQNAIGIIELASFVKFDSFIEQVLSEYAALIGPPFAEINRPAEKVE